MPTSCAFVLCDASLFGPTVRFLNNFTDSLNYEQKAKIETFHRHGRKSTPVIADNHWHRSNSRCTGSVAERPDDGRGLAVRGMVLGSPGMEGPNPVPYNVLAYRSDGNITVYTARQGRNSPEK